MTIESQMCLRPPSSIMRSFCTWILAKCTEDFKLDKGSNRDRTPVRTSIAMAYRQSRETQSHASHHLLCFPDPAAYSAAIRIDSLLCARCLLRVGCTYVFVQNPLDRGEEKGKRVQATQKSQSWSGRMPGKEPPSTQISAGPWQSIIPQSTSYSALV